jgi:hypothetical protein
MRILALVLTLIVARTVWAQSKDELVASARRALAAGQYEKAERLFEQVVESDPHDMEAWEGYKMAYEKRRAQEEGGAAEPRTRETAEDAEPPPRPEAPEKRRSAPRYEEEAPSSETATGDDGGKAPPRPESLGQVDKNLVRNHKKAKERFEEMRDARSANYKRLRGGCTTIVATFYDRELYRTLAVLAAARKGYDVKRAQRIYEQFMRDMRGQLEFYVKLANYCEKPKISVSIGDIVERTMLMDEEGNAYRPVRWKAPQNKDLVGEDAYTVWFSRTDSEGEDILRRARETMWIVVNDLPREAKTIQLAFKTRLLGGEGKGVSKGKSITQRMKDLFK